MAAFHRGCALTLATLCVLVTAKAPAAEAPLFEWRFEPAHVAGTSIKALAGGLDATANKPARLSGSPAYIDLDGTEFALIAPKGSPVALPTREITVEAWVSLREAGEWGGFVGYVQDNGSYEKGWVLGNRQDRFCFALSSQGADDGDGVLTYLQASDAVPLRRWCHVVGTYDGANLRVYVNGKPSASSTAQSGDILYDDSDFVLAAYKDDNEHFCVNGGMSLARVYGSCLGPDEVKARYETTRAAFAAAPPLPAPKKVFAPILIDGPWATFDAQSDTIIRWDTQEPCPTSLTFSQKDAAAETVRNDTPTRRHQVRLENLKRNTAYTYTIRVPGADGIRETQAYTLDTRFDYTAPPLPTGVTPYPPNEKGPDFAQIAREILEQSGIDRGYCLDCGCGEGRLAYELAKRSSLRVVGLSTDAEAVARGREKLLAQGCYGPRITLRHMDSFDELPVPDLSCNLVVSAELLSGGDPPAPAAEVFSKLRPLGGKAYFVAPNGGEGAIEPDALKQWLQGARTPPQAAVSATGVPSLPRDPVFRMTAAQDNLWATLSRPRPLPGAGRWTHAYGDAAQTANSGDRLVRGAAGSTFEVQWFGLPGPNAMVDRLARKQGPLSTAGRLFTLGNDRIIAQDAYNGTIVWSVEMPGLLRNNIPRNTGNACANGSHVFVAMRDRCWRLDAATGRRSASYRIPAMEAEGELLWGYVAVRGDLLVGSAVKRGNFETEYRGPRFWFDSQSGRDVLNVCSEGLFACEIDEGEPAWSYSGGLIINSTISMGEGRLYFLESRVAEAIQAPSRQLGAELWGTVSLVALDARTGRKLWQRPFDHPDAPIVIYLVCSEGRLAAISSLKGEYRIQTFAADDGAEGWKAQDKWRSDNHGHHIQHPVLAMGRLYQEPHVYEWKTGRKLDVVFPSRSKCGTITGAAGLLHYRDYSDEVWDLRTNTASEFSKLRSGCWIGMISGSGLLMSPESAGGCSCRWPIYTSLTYRTKDDY